LYRQAVSVESVEHAERRDWLSFVARLSVSLRTRVAAARPKREAASLSEVQESQMGHPKSPQRRLEARSFEPWAAIDPEGIYRCMIRFG
jgi:hypothetical protein